MISANPNGGAVQRTAIRFVLAAGLAIAALAATQSWVESRAAATGRAVQTAAVLVTARTVEAGTVIGKADLRWQPWPVALVAPDWLVGGKGDAAIIGRVAPVRLVAGMPVTLAMAIAPGSGSAFAAAIRPGWRAASIAVTPAAGLAGFVTPGDHVDVLLTQTLGNRRTVQTLLADVGVLGVDQAQRGTAMTPIDPAVDIVADAVADSVAPPDLVTLEVTPGQAEALAIAAELGKLSLVLRGPGRDSAPNGGRRWDSDVTGLSPAQLAAGSAPAVPNTIAAAPTMMLPPPAVQVAPPPPRRGVEIVYGLPQAEAAVAEPVK